MESFLFEFKKGNLEISILKSKAKKLKVEKSGYNLNLKYLIPYH